VVIKEFAAKEKLEIVKERGTNKNPPFKVVFNLTQVRPV